MEDKLFYLRKIDTPVMKQERTTVETSKEDNAREVLEANNGINDTLTNL